jgi:hypothetical protein
VSDSRPYPPSLEPLIRLLEGEGRTLIKQLQSSTGGKAEGSNSKYDLAYNPWRDTPAGRLSGSGSRNQQGRGQGKKRRESSSDSDDSSGISDPGYLDSDELSDDDGGGDQDDDDDDNDDDGDGDDRRGRVSAKGSRAVKGPSSISKRSESAALTLL